MMDAMSRATEAADRTDDLLAPEDVAGILGICTRALRLWVAKGLFPPPLRPGGLARARWPREVVEAHRRRKLEAAP
jgi:hypothetical protein